MGVARIGPPGCGHRTPAVVVLGNEAAAAVKNPLSFVAALEP